MCFGAANAPTLTVECTPPPRSVNSRRASEIVSETVDNVKRGKRRQNCESGLVGEPFLRHNGRLEESVLSDQYVISMTFDTPSKETESAAPDDPSYAPMGTTVHVAFLPERDAPRFFVWGNGALQNSFAGHGVPESAVLADESLATREIAGVAVPLLSALPYLAAMPVDLRQLSEESPSLAVWSLAAKLALDLVARERIVPRVVKHGRATQARSSVVLSLREDFERFAALAKAFPLAAHAVPVAKSNGKSIRRNSTSAVRVWTADALLRIFLDIVADTLARATQSPIAHEKKSGWPSRLLGALHGKASHFAAEGFQERSLLEELETWVQPLLGNDAGAPRACFRLELPAANDAAAAPKFYLRFLLQAADDANLLADAADIFAARKKVLADIHCTARIAEERLLQGLNIAARIFAPIGRSLHQARPEGVELSADLAWQFISNAAPALHEAGLSVIVPAELTPGGQRRLHMRMRIGADKKRVADMSATLSLRNALPFHWEARIGDERLTLRKLKELAALKAPLVLHRGRWVAINRDELAHAARLLAEGGGTITAAAALAAALSESAEQGATSLPIEVAAEGQIEQVLRQLREPNSEPIAVPPDFHGELRPYQERGLAWLAQMSRLGLGACLADDMGLGKTIQLLAFLLYRRVAQKDDMRPVLLVCPTSVIGNWQREVMKFAPSLNVIQHYGNERVREASAFAALPPATVALTSYGLLRRDAALLGSVDWAVVVLDEAQNIKNTDSRTARVARSLPADFRIALTGTPIENRLTELWSIFEFLNPGLLGPLARFQREVAIPIERFGRNDVADRLKRIVRPLLLRRVKTDPSIIQDLPSKQEMEVFCTLTREQASLYESAVDAAMATIEGADGIERRGQVLALITALKQICNHPAQYLHEAGPLPQRSGKLQRLSEMLEEIVANGDRALIFTQYREMGDRLVRELQRVLGVEILYLHGGTPRAQRDLMIKRFQESSGARVFILSVKAGGTGLNLTVATHVFHYDRWWNPAVEDQATDRAYRIGQRRHVQVHKFLCAGTIEEKVDALLKTKRDLASRIVGQGEQWITELDNVALRELFALSANAVIDGDTHNGDADAEVGE